MSDSVTVVGLGFTNLHNMMSGIIVYELTQYTLTLYNFPLFPSSSAFLCRALSSGYSLFSVLYATVSQ